MISFAVTVFLSAFLLFQIQPIIAKMILPWFGGSSSVWSVCLVFFQAELLLGYLYVHLLHESFSPRRQNVVHCVLLALSLATLPVVADPAWKEAAFEHPTWNVIVVLALAVGMPYLLLSTTGPLMQAWYARSFRSMVPYRLYALSNLASDARAAELSGTRRTVFSGTRAGLGLVGRLCPVRAGLFRQRLAVVARGIERA